MHAPSVRAQKHVLFLHARLFCTVSIFLSLPTHGWMLDYWGGEGRGGEGRGDFLLFAFMNHFLFFNIVTWTIYIHDCEIGCMF